MTKSTESHVKVFDPVADKLDWVPGALPHDQTPAGVVDPERVRLFTSEDGKIKVYFWRRDMDIGRLSPYGGSSDTVKLDIVLKGKVQVTDNDGIKHHAGKNSALFYRGSDDGAWEQHEPVIKLALAIQE